MRITFLAIVLLFPVQAKDDALGALKVPAGHPRILITAADLPALRARLAEGSGPRLADQARSYLADLDPAKPYASTSSLQVRCHMLSEATATIAFHALLAGDEATTRAVNAFFEALDVSSIETQLPKNEFMPRGEFLYGLAIALDWAHSILSVKGRENLASIVRRNAQENYLGISGNKSWEGACEANNHSMASMGGVGLAGLALWGDDKNAKAWVELTSRKVKAYLEQSFDENGACFEGNLYGPFGLMLALPFSASLKNLGGPDLMGSGRLLRAVHWMVSDLLPGAKKMNPLNDASGGTIPGNLALYAATTFKDGLCRWAWDNAATGTWAPYRFLWDDASIPATPPGPEFLDRRHKGRGLVTVRTGFGVTDCMASFECGARRAGCHCQADQGQFTLYGNGAEFIVDTLYSNQLEEGSANQTVGHNLVLINGKGQSLSGGGQIVEGKILSQVSDDVLAAAVGDLAPAYGAKGYNVVQKALRTFVWIKSSKRPCLIILDEILKAGGSDKYESLLHTSRGNKVTWEKSEATIDAGGARLRVRYVSPLRIATTTRQMAFKGPSLGDHPVLVASFEGRGWLCATVFSFDEEGVTVTGEAKGDRLEIDIRREAEEDHITIHPRPDKSPAIFDVTRKSGGKQVYRKKF